MDDFDPRIFSSGPVALFQWESADQCPILSVSPNIEKILGYTVDELTVGKKRYAELIHPDDRQEVYRQIDKNLAADINEFERMDYRLIRKDSSVIWVEDHTVVIRDERGEPVQFIGYIIDITQRHLAEQENITNREKMQAITELMTDWAWEVDQNGVYTYCSDRVKKFLGYSAEEIIGKTPFELMPEHEAKRVGEIFVDIVKQKAPIQNLENWNQHKNGKPVCLLTNGIPLLSESGELLGYRGVDTDITEQKNNEQLLRRAHNAAVESLQVKNEFLANISHELRTPLNGINGALQLLEQTELSAEQLQYFSIASNSNEQLLELVNNLLNYSSIQAGRIMVQKQPASIREILQSQQQLTSMLIKDSDINVELSIEDDVPDEIQTDPIWLKQVISNITGNAIKFTPTGRILISATNEPVANRLKIEIQDSGIGISKDQCEKIFEPFYQIDSGHTRKFDGAGLGLAISKDVINHLGGEIGIESQPGHGTNVWFTLPLASLSDRVCENG
jgi:PAS domain S-box-containing protein